MTYEEYLNIKKVIIQTIQEKEAEEEAKEAGDDMEVEK